MISVDPFERLNWYIFAFQGWCSAVKLYNSAWRVWQHGTSDGMTIGAYIWELAAMLEFLTWARLDVARGRMHPDVYRAYISNG